ncbi:MAG: glycoside hydrolase family 3 C-terminal domain-containing protein [Rubrobacter sp.]|nr:glycoside hydrolase family 3 C-terminal domain-containing protein [Rubrobacter sp.]
MRMVSRRGYLVGVLITLVMIAGTSVAGSAGPNTGGSASVDIDRKISNMSLKEKVGQMFVPYVYGESANTTNPADVAANQEMYGVNNAEGVIRKYKPGGIIYFAWSNNVNNPAQIANLSNGIQSSALAQRSKIPMLISTDQEQGVVVRVNEPATQFPGSMALGASRSTEHARTAATITGQELKAMGINQNFAPDADVNVNAQNPVIGVRSFGSNPGLVSDMVSAQVAGYQGGAGISSTAKHFPGHGDTAVDSHYGLPIINHSREELNQIDLPPFQAAIDSNIDAIMTAHIVVPALDPSGRPATLSKPILMGLLRQEMGFKGVIVTDALTMEGVRQQFGDARVPVEAIKAGADMMLMPPDMDAAYGGVLDAVRSGEIKEKRIDASVHRILALKAKRGVFQNPYVDEGAVNSTVGTSQHKAAAGDITDDTITLVKNDTDTLPLQANSGKNVLVTGAGGVAGSQADQADRSTLGSLAYQIAQRGASTTVYETGANPDDASITEAKTRATNNDLVVVTTNKAWASAGQQKLVQSLLDSGTPVIVVATRDPYDIAYFDSAPTYLATYSYRAVSMESLTRVLFGEVNPTGKLPVDIPAASDPSTALYPYGYGLGYGG